MIKAISVVGGAAGGAAGVVADGLSWPAEVESSNCARSGAVVRHRSDGPADQAGFELGERSIDREVSETRHGRQVV